MLSRIAIRYNTLAAVAQPLRVGQLRCFAAPRSVDVDEEELTAARAWLAKLNAETIPRDVCEVTFSRSSGPGGQNVNKTSSKATLRLPASALLARLPKLLHSAVLSSRYYAPKSEDIVIQADDARKQGDNVNHCFRRLHDMIVQAGKDVIPGETSAEQSQRVVDLQKAEAAGRKRLKQYQSSKKSARRSTGRGPD